MAALHASAMAMLLFALRRLDTPEVNYQSKHVNSLTICVTAPVFL